jgi:putative phosphoribosyl transferase
MQFENREQAGRWLGQALLDHVGQDTLVLGLPRGGVPVAFQVARTLDAPLDIWIVRKLGAPSQPELGLGALAEGPAIHLNRQLIADLGISDREVMQAVRREARELRARVARFRGARALPDLRGRTVILVDDGIATGGTTRAAIKGVRKLGAAQVIVAAPIASPSVIATLRPAVDGILCLSQPAEMFAIGAWYEDFRQVPDEEVNRLLGIARWRAEIAVARGYPGAQPMR